MTIVEFLLARIAEDEAAAQAANHDGPRWWCVGHGGSVIIRDENRNPVVYDEGSPTEEQAAHIVRWDPARVLAECEAKRRIVAKVESRFFLEFREGALLELLAAPYADHPDFNPEWAA